MTAHRIDGNQQAQEVREAIRSVVQRLAVKPGLALIRVGDDPASEIYVNFKHQACQEVGFQSWNLHLPADTAQEDVIQRVKALNYDPSVHGILIQLPLPEQISPEAVIDAIDPRKDVDGLHPLNGGKLLNGDPFLIPCTPQGCLHLIKSVEPNLAGKRAVIIGRSSLVGKPLFHLLLQEDCTVTIVHSKTQNIEAVCRSADILVAAVGCPRLVKGDWVKPGAMVIDVGISRLKGSVVGDVDYEEVCEGAGALTPVPGGVGPMTVAYLLKNTLKSALHFQGMPETDL